MPLTDPACKNAKCPEDRPRLRLADSGGLYLEVQPNGAKHWRYKYRFAGKEKRLAIGTYPAVSLAEARRQRDKAREVLRGGTDPVQAKKDTRLAKQIAMGTTFEAVALQWFENWSGAKSPRHADYVKRRLEGDVFPAIGSKPIAEVTAPHLLAMARKIEARKALDIARRAWQTCGQIFEFALAHGLVERNPAKDVRPGAALKSRTKKHYARVEAKELPELLRKIAAYNGSPYTRAALQLIALTFVRTSELIEARWDEFDLDAAEWRIPAERMKMATPHTVPLSRQAVDVLRCLMEIRLVPARLMSEPPEAAEAAAPSGGEPKKPAMPTGLLFPGERDHDKPMSNNTILGALKRMGYAGRMTGHGFRGVASTILHEHGFDHAHIELQLAHQERNAVSAAYNFATYLPQRRQMMQWYADHLDALRQGAKIIPFKAA